MPGQERKRNPRALFVQGERLCTRCSLDVSQGHSWCSRWRTAASLRGAVTEGWWSFARSEGSAGGVPAFHKVIKVKKDQRDNLVQPSFLYIAQLRGNGMSRL